MNKENRIQEIVKRQNLTELLHFTKVDNLQGILEHGLLSRSDMHNKRINISPSHDLRMDNACNAISVSISAINLAMFKSKVNKNPRSKWVVLGLKPSILWTHDCRFYCRNAATNEMSNENTNHSRPYYLEEMFNKVIPRKKYKDVERASDLPTYFTTCHDAEVQVFDPISPDLIFGLWVESEKVIGHLNGMIEYFKGNQNRHLLVEGFEGSPYFR